MTGGEYILVVETDPDISDLICRQALVPLGHNPRLVQTAAAALEQARRSAPSLIISSLQLPDLSGRDLLTAFSSTGVSAPLVVVAEKGDEQGVIQAFRLGAVDAVFWPARDCEVVQVVERALKQVRAARARQKLDRDLESVREELERRVQNLTTMLGFSKALVTVPDQRQFFENLLDAALQLGQAQTAWLVVRDDSTGQFLLYAQRGLPLGWARKINQPLDDGLTSLVALSGRPLTIHGAALSRFKVAALGRSAAVLPAKVRRQVVAILAVVRGEAAGFDTNATQLLGALADFAAISLMNSTLFKALGNSGIGHRATHPAPEGPMQTLPGVAREPSPLQGGEGDGGLFPIPIASPSARGLGGASVPSSWDWLRHSTQTGEPPPVPESA